MEENQQTTRLVGALGAERLNQACERVRSLVPYLRAEVGDRGRVLEHGVAARDGEWVDCASFVNDPAWVETIIGATGRTLGTDDPVVAASLFVQNYSYRVVSLAVAAMTSSSVVPESAASSMAFCCSKGRPSSVAYTRPIAYELAEQTKDPAAVFDHQKTVDAALDLVIAGAIGEHVALLVDAVRARTHVGARLLWGNVAASSAVAFRTMEGCQGPWVRPLGERFFTRCPDEMKGLGSFFALECDGRRGWYFERKNCCLYDRLPGKIRCGDCSLTPAGERRASYLAALAAES